MKDIRGRTAAAASRIALAAAALVGLWLAPARLGAQATGPIAGTVRDSEGQPLAGSIVLLVGTGERAVTDSAGEFVFDTAARESVVLIVRRPGYWPLRRALRLPLDRPLALIMRLLAPAREPLPAEAGAFRLGGLPGATLTDLDLVRTPGAAGDPFRALQSLPGLQNVGNGAGLFARGGAAHETRVLVDGLTVMSPLRQESERTVSFGRFDPFHVRGIHFSTGGFSAEYGDALSAVADIEMAGKPIRDGLRLTASTAGLAGDLNLELSESAGVRVSAGHANTDLFLRMNGRRDEFDEVPRSTDFDAAGEWIYRPGGSVRASMFVHSDRFGVRFEHPAASGIYRSDASSTLLTVSGRDVLRGVRLYWTVATGGARQDEDLGELRLDRSDRLTQARAKAEMRVGSGVVLTAGAEIGDRRMDLTGSVPVEVDLPRGPRTIRIPFSDRGSGSRLGGFGELEMQPASAVRFRLGLRSDRSSFTGRATLDPRLSASFRAARNLTLTAAWGVFHQVPDPRLYAGRLGDPTLPAMSARHLIGGVAYDDGDRLIRAEAYRKRYADLAARGRDGAARGGGSGEARGFDVLIKEELGLLGLTARVAYGYIRAERTDPDTGEMAPSPYDATHTFNAILNRGFGWLRIGVGLRIAEGVPFTPVEGAAFDEELELWRPAYGAPMSARLPAYSRLDLSASVVRSLWRRNVTVFFLSIMNALDHPNISTYHYNRDYSERVSPETSFPRSVFFGVTTTLPF